MIYSSGKKIWMYEGDTGYLDMTIKGDIQPTDVIEFRIKEKIDDENCIFIQQDSDITDGIFTLRIDQTDTAKLPAKAKDDKEYYWGLKLYRNGTEIDTLEAKNPFLIKKEV